MGSERIGLIGCGEMGSALFAPIVEHAAECWVCSPSRNFSSVPWTSQSSVHLTRHSEDVFSNCSIVFIATPPSALLPLLEKHAPLIRTKAPLIVSMCGRGSLDEMKNVLTGSAAGADAPPPLFRIMPNTPTEIGCGATALASGSNVSAKDSQRVMEVLKPTGSVIVIDEAGMRDFTVAYSCTPAYNYLMFEALSDAAVARGMPRAVANELAIYNTLAACEAAAESPVRRGAVFEACKRHSPAPTLLPDSEGLQAI